MDDQERGQAHFRCGVGRAGEEAVDHRPVGAARPEAFHGPQANPLEEGVVHGGHAAQPGGRHRRDFGGDVGLALQYHQLTFRPHRELLNVALPRDHALDRARRHRYLREVAVASVLEHEEQGLSVGGEKWGPEDVAVQAFREGNASAARHGHHRHRARAVPEVRGVAPGHVSDEPAVGAEAREPSFHGG
jgi:hypothetical protein